MTGSFRGVSAAFNAIVMVGAAYSLTGGSLADPGSRIVLWGSAAAAVVAALVVLTNGPAIVGWAALGYVIFAAVLATVEPVPLLLLLAVAFLPILERPRGSIAIGLGVSVATAVALRVLLDSLAR